MSFTRVAPDSGRVAVAKAHALIPNLDRLDFKEFFVTTAPNTDDPDGCCIQWVPGQAKGCRQTKQKQCKDDAEAVNAKCSWHAGACTDADGCH